MMRYANPLTDTPIDIDNVLTETYSNFLNW